MDYNTMAHRWCNQDFGRNNGFSGKSVYCTEWNYYSYSTVIAQWLDKERKIMVILDDNVSTSKTTARHRCGVRAGVTEDTTVLPYCRIGSYSSWNSAELCCYGGHFNYNDRVELLEYYICNMYDAYAEINNSKSISCLNFDDYWKYADKLCELYKDTSFQKWIRKPSNRLKGKAKKDQLTKMRKLVKLHLDGVTETADIIDGVFGEGSWKEFEKRTESLRKASKTREYIAMVNRHVGYDPHRYCVKDLPYKSMAQINSEGPKMIMLRKFDKIWHDKYDDIFRSNKKKAVGNAIKYLGIAGNSEIYGYTAHRYDTTVKEVWENGTLIYKSTYHYREWRVLGFVSVPSIEFNYKDFATFPDAKEFKRNFIKKAKILGRLENGKNLFVKIHVNELTVDELDVEQTHMYNEFCQFLEKEQNRVRSRQKAEENKKARAAKEKAEKIEAYKLNGVDGIRDLWRERLCSLYEYEGLENLYSGGNVLLRWSKNHDYIETSKNIRLSIEQCKKYWRIISIWHEDPSKFKPVDMETKSGTYHVVSYKDDVLTAGCHRISYFEMKRIMSEILSDAA